MQCGRKFEEAAGFNGPIYPSALTQQPKNPGLFAMFVFCPFYELRGNLIVVSNFYRSLKFLINIQ